MKQFKGRITRIDEDEYIVEDEDSSDSEVGGIYEEEDLELLFTPVDEDESEEEISLLNLEEWPPIGLGEPGGQISQAAAEALRSGHASLEAFIRAAILRNTTAEERRGMDQPQPVIEGPRSSTPIEQTSQGFMDGMDMMRERARGVERVRRIILLMNNGAAGAEEGVELGTIVDTVVGVPGEEEEAGEVREREESAVPGAHVDDGGKVEEDENSTEVEKEELTCNPMVSDEGEEDEEENGLRGDRIGSTTYSERHVLKILMNWVKNLPSYSEEGIKKKGEGAVDTSKLLEPEFEVEMSLLWDMSYESDVISFLLQHSIFSIIRKTLDGSGCDRLTEISLGIMANCLSQQSILQDFPVQDKPLALVSSVIGITIKIPRVSVLIQAFSVLRRITWFLQNVAGVEEWMKGLTSPEFLNCSNFILSSSTNVLLLGNVIVTLFSLVAALGSSLPGEDGEEDEEQEQSTTSVSSFFGDALEDASRKEFEGFRPFCETGFVVALVEGMNELGKDPLPRKVHKLTSSHHQSGDGVEGEEDFEPPIPDGHVQQAMLNGLSSLVYLHKTPNGKNAIRENNAGVYSLLLKMLEKFPLYTDDLKGASTLDYFSLAMALLTFCHKERSFLSREGLTVPLELAAYFMSTSLNSYDGKESVSFVALVVHEYLSSLEERFGPEGIQEFKSGSDVKIKRVLEQVEASVGKIVCSSQQPSEKPSLLL